PVRPRSTPGPWASAPEGMRRRPPTRRRAAADRGGLRGARGRAARPRRAPPGQRHRTRRRTTPETTDVTSRSTPGAPSAPPPRPRGVRLAATVLACALAVAWSPTMPATHAADVPQPSVHDDISDLDAIELPRRTTENLPLVAETVEGAEIVWESSDPSVITPTDPDHAAPEVGMDDPFAGAGVLTRPAYGQGDTEVTLTATASLGERTETREYAVTVAEMPRTAPDAGDAAARFRSNAGAPVVPNEADTTGHRDPYILRSHDGDRYYMIATDLCIGCGTGWGEAQSDGSLKVNVWESTDMVHWERTNGDGNGAIPVNRPEAGMTWAPEAYWDDDLQSYVLFFASRLYDDVDHTGGEGHAQMFAVLTRDFVTFTSPPASWQNTGHARIDSTVQKIGEYYYRFTKN